MCSRCNQSILFVVTLLFLFFTPVRSKAQNDTFIDSLKNELRHTTDDKIRSKLYFTIAFGHYNNTEYDSTSEYIMLGMDLALRKGYRKSLAGNYMLAANLLSAFGEYKKSYEYAGEALNIYIDRKDTLSMCATYNNIGVVYFHNKKYNEALANYEKALNLALQSDKTNESLADYYMNMGEAYLYLKQYGKALAFERKAAGAAIEDKPGEVIAFVNDIMGRVYYEMKDYQKAREHLGRSISLFEEIDDNFYLCMPVSFMAKTLAAENQYDSALHLLRGKFIGRPVPRQWRKDAYEQIAMIFRHKKNADSAYFYLQAADVLKDSIYKETLENKVSQVSSIYELAKKENLIDNLKNDKLAQEKENKQQRLISWFLTGGFVVVSCLTFLLFFTYRQKIQAFNEVKEKNEEISMQSELLQQTNRLLDAEKKKSDELLLNVLPETIVDELKLTGIAKPRYYERVTIVFADFVNFTLYAENNTPQQTTEQLDYLFLLFDKICVANRLEKIKTIGDCYMATGGLPVVNESNATDAVKAAIEMLASIENLGWQLRIGIHTGPVVAGVIGVNKFAYDVWGDSVNMAARMEQSGESDQINISQSTYDLVKEAYPCTYRGKIHAKNKGNVDMYFVDIPKGG